jgi:ribonuclease-3
LIHPPEQLCNKLGLRFHDLAWVRRALTHRSANGVNNERLEFLGDSILGFVIAEWLYERFPQADEGILSRLRASLVNQTVLAELARSYDIGDHLILGAGELKSGGYRRDSILSDVMEALIGALYLDQGMDACKTWLRQLFAGRVATLSAEPARKDPKTCLQEWLQARGEELPAYALLSVSGEPHQPTFHVECRVALLREASSGMELSRRKAEQQAAERMLERLTMNGRSE